MLKGAGFEMDYASSHVVYVDNRLSSSLDGQHLQKLPQEAQKSSKPTTQESWEDKNAECLKALQGEIEEIRQSLRNLLSIFDGVYPCVSGDTCKGRLDDLESDSRDQRPLFVVISLHIDESLERHLDSDGLIDTARSTPDHGAALVRHISRQVADASLSKRVIPVAMIHDFEFTPALNEVAGRSGSRPSSGAFASKSSKPSRQDRKSSLRALHLDPIQLTRYIDLGAVEVLPSPLTVERLNALVSHGYRAHKLAAAERAEKLRQKKARKLSWLGSHDERPYAYLREKMVSELMTGICNPDGPMHRVDYEPNTIKSHREAEVKQAIASWAYCGHDFDDDELISAACCMLQHALSLPELEKFRLSTKDLRTFLLASRAAYNSFVNYHNFRHVIDVMQAIFHFLVQIGTLPPYTTSSNTPSDSKMACPIGALLKPFDALTLLITAIGHDVGHPGVNNAFLVSLNAPLAQLYNDKSVLEAFHCAAYSQILRRHWTAAFEDIPMRSLMINSILATDMGVHMKYMSDLGNLQEKLHHNQGTDGWSVQILDDYRVLACALLVKCADISNVARPFNVALQWADKLQLEFANQGTMEQELKIPTTLFGGPPELGNTIKLGKSQISFMNIFARPLFEAVTDILPAMAFTVDEMKRNQDIWSNRIREEEVAQSTHDKGEGRTERPVSPRSTSPSKPVNRPQSSHPEGLPASDHQSTTPTPSAGALNTSTDTPRVSSSSAHQQAALNILSNSSRRSSAGQPPGLPNSTSQPTLSSSRRSSGALSTSNLPLSVITTRRTSNGSPSQLQLGPDLRSNATSSTVTSENQQPNAQESDDTLSHTRYGSKVAGPPEDRQTSLTSAGSSIGRLSSKGSAPDNIRGLQGSTSQASNRPFAHSGHQRSSSGAHTTNTNLSQSTPYSPTGTQATSVLSTDSDEPRSQGNPEADRGSAGTRTVPKMMSFDQHLHPQGGLDGTQDTDVKTSVVNNNNNGTLKDASSIGYRSLGRKGSRFNFSFFKRKGRGFETTGA